MKHVSVFLWQGLHPSIKQRLTSAPVKFFPGLQTPVPRKGSITLTGAEQGAADAHRRDAIKRGGV